MNLDNQHAAANHSLPAKCWSWVGPGATVASWQQPACGAELHTSALESLARCVFSQASTRSSPKARAVAIREASEVAPSLQHQRVPLPNRVVIHAGLSSSMDLQNLPPLGFPTETRRPPRWSGSEEMLPSSQVKPSGIPPDPAAGVHPRALGPPRDQPWCTLVDLVAGARSAEALPMS
jgi:hypothetical protein